LQHKVALVTSSDIENQKLFLMLDAVSAHTDCLIQIVKERCSFFCCGSGILLNRLLESSLICKGFSRLSTQAFCVAACRVDGGAL
ncbi:MULTISPECIES: hypothetical protein, partial [Aeromonas]|uniref:hypothetical protein n=1 Tax=Aeromonas TaxID=642 RepID=UPI002B05F4BA